MNKLAIFITSAFVSLFITLGVISFSNPVFAQFDSITDSCEGIPPGESAVCDDARTNADPTKGDSIFVTIANVLSVVAGVIAVIIIIVSGITMMTSGGDPGKVKTARDGIIYAVIGLVVIVLARSLVLYVISLVG